MKKSLLLTVVLASSCVAGGDQFIPIDGEDLEITRQQNEVARYFAKDPEILKAQLASYDNQGDANQFLYVISKRLIDQERYQDALGIARQVNREYLTPEMQDNFDFNRGTLYTLGYRVLAGITPTASLQEAWRLLKTKKTSLAKNFLALGAKNLSLEEQKNPSPETIEKGGQVLLGYMKDMNALVEGNTDPWVMATVLYFKTLLSEAADAAHQPLLLEIFKDILSHPNTNEELYIPFLCAQNFFGKHTEFKRALRQTSKIRVSGKSLSKEGWTL